MSESLKIKVNSFVKDYAHSKVHSLKTRINEVVEALNSETKSSAGDKHETGRAMLQLEREKLGKQLAEAEKLQAIAERIPLKKQGDNIRLGSLVQTNTAHYYISISAGRFQLEDMQVFCISASSPIGQVLLGKTVGDGIEFKGVVQKVVNVY